MFLNWVIIAVNILREHIGNLIIDYFRSKDQFPNMLLKSTNLFFMKNLLFWSALFTITMFLACNSEQTNTQAAQATQTKSFAERKTPESKMVQETPQSPTKTVTNPSSKATASKTQETNLSESPQTAKTALKPSRQVVKENIPDTKITMNKEQGKTAAAIPVTINPSVKPPTKTVGNSSTTGTVHTAPAQTPVVKKVEEVVKVVKTEVPVKPEQKPTIQDKPENKPADKPQLSHDTWDQLLRKHVSASGKVNYAGFKADKNKLDAYLEMLDKLPIQDSWPKAKKMAYWINAYNAATVKLIVDNYPVKSIMDLDGGKPWDRKWVKLGGKAYSLNNIENDILRPQYKDARIHFAVNCAAKSCPPLLNRAWTAANLERNFEKQAKSFINNPQYNEVDKKRVRISKIFEWYAVDFGDIVSYLNKYANNKANSNAKVEYLEYDWSLNQ